MLTSRRGFLGHAARMGAAGGMMATGVPALASLQPARSLAFDNLHTNERISLVYAVGSEFVPDSLNRLNLFLRDHYTGDVGTIDPQLFDLLHRLRATLGSRQQFEVISGYRSPGTNQRLKNTRGGGVAVRSLHMVGQAIDIRLPGTALEDLRDAAVSMQAGGVGFYPKDRFVHIDTGRVRTW